ncbi:MAG: hypothetical protein ACR2PM_00760 [Hyphomicrobiales bacterium]
MKGVKESVKFSPGSSLNVRAVRMDRGIGTPFTSDKDVNGVQMNLKMPRRFGAVAGEYG